MLHLNHDNSHQRAQVLTKAGLALWAAGRAPCCGALLAGAGWAALQQQCRDDAGPSNALEKPA